MKTLLTDAIILARVDYGEADRILTLLTPEQGKISLVAKGVRRVKSKLAGGIELFSVTQLSYMPGRSGLGTLVSSRLDKYYRHIVKDINRTMLGYDLIKQLHKATEDNPEPAYFELLQEAFAALDDDTLSLELIKVWFAAQLLRLSGHTPNLQTDTAGNKLDATARYDFGFEETSLTLHPTGALGVNHIKFLRLLFATHTPRQLAQVQGSDTLATAALPLVQSLCATYLRP